MSFARVHEDLVLPSIEDLVGLDDEPSDWSAQTRIQTTASVRRIPCANAIVRSAARPPAPPVGHVVYEPHPTPIPTPPSTPPTRLMPPPFPRTVAQTVLTRRTAEAMRWPVFLCGFVAGIFGGMALLKSPVGHSPAVQHVMSSVRAVVR